MTTTLRIFFREAVGLLVDNDVVFESITDSDFFEGFCHHTSYLVSNFPWLECSSEATKLGAQEDTESLTL